MISLNLCLNIINRLCAQDRVPADTFGQFLDFDPTHRGVTGVIYGADLTEKWQLRLINLPRPARIDVRTHLIDLVH